MSQQVVPDEAFLRLEEMAETLDWPLEVAADGKSITIGTVDNPDYHCVIAYGNGNGPIFNGYNQAMIVKIQKVLNGDQLDTPRPKSSSKPTKGKAAKERSAEPKKPQTGTPPKPEPNPEQMATKPASTSSSTSIQEVPNVPTSPGPVETGSASSAPQRPATKPASAPIPAPVKSNSSMQIRPASRKMGKLKAALTGQTGSGKTATALLIASGVVDWQDIVLIDTEESGDNYRGQIIAGTKIGPYNVLKMERPFTPEKYIQALEAVEDGGYKLAIIDSLSHAWMGEGGVLDFHEKEARSGKGEYRAWAKPKQKNHRLLERITHSKVHTICTMRSRMETAMITENGKTEVKKFGLKPIQENDTEYEFDLVIDLDRDHTAHVTKDRTNQFTDEYFEPGVKTGNILINWLNEEN